MKTAGLVLVLIVFILGLGYFLISCNPLNKCFATSNVEEVSMEEHLSASEFDQAIKSGEFKLIDVRTIEEYNEGHLKGSTQVDFNQTQKFESFLDSLDKNGKYLIYCRSSNRSGRALSAMKQAGFKNVSDLAGGIIAWKAGNYPVEN